MSFPQYLMSDFDAYGDRVALIDGLSKRSYTFRQLKELVHRCGSGLVRAGFQPGDVCAICKPNSPEYFVTFNSVLSVGGVVTSVNPQSTADDMIYLLNLSDAKWIITVPEFVEKAKKAAEALARIKNIYVMGDESIGGCTPFSKLMEDDGSAFPTDVNVNPKEDVAFLPYSSGTTGLPKCVMITHYNLIANIEQQRSPGYLRMQPGADVYMTMLPFFHTSGISSFLGLGTKQGVKLITLPKFEPETFLRTIQEYGVTRLFIGTSTFMFLSKHPLVDEYDLSSIEDVVFGGAPAGADTIKAVRGRLGNANLHVGQGYGMSELSHLVTLVSTQEKFNDESVGSLLPNTEAKVIDLDSGETVGVGQNGELCFRGPQVMKGYLKNVEATKKTLIGEGWIHTGDFGHYDEKGHFYVIDRLKELIKYHDLQISPAELEKVILSMPDIQDVVVVGKPDEEAGEVPKALVIPKSDQLKVEDIVKFVEGKVAPYKKLRGGVEFVSEIPKSATGKSLRRLLKARETDRH